MPSIEARDSTLCSGSSGTSLVDAKQHQLDGGDFIPINIKNELSGTFLCIYISLLLFLSFSLLSSNDDQDQLSLLLFLFLFFSFFQWWSRPTHSWRSFFSPPYYLRAYIDIYNWGVFFFWFICQGFGIHSWPLRIYFSKPIFIFFNPDCHRIFRIPGCQK